MMTRKVFYRLLPTFVLAVLLWAGCSGARETTREAALPPQARDSSVVAILDGEPITVSEIERRYRRSLGGNSSAVPDSAELRDFLDRYLNFRLKVKAAEDAGIGDLPEIQEEIDTYRLQLARPYMLEQEVLEPIIREVYTRSQDMVDASHILIRVAPDAPPADTLEAYNMIRALIDSVKAGVDFGELALRYSEDPSASREGPGYKGRLGFFTAGQMVAPFEDAAYNTPVGQVSDIVRTRFGYHILYVHDRRPAIPDIEVAHIMIIPRGPTGADTAAALEQIEELRRRFENGEDFRALAREYSMDHNTREQGGRLGIMTFNNPVIPPEFRDAAFAIENPGEISDVVQSRFGFHLIYLIDRKERKPFEEAYEDLKTQVMRLPRTEQAQRAFARQARARYGVTVDTAQVRAVLDAFPADTIIAHLAVNDFDALFEDTTFATIGDAGYTLSDFFAFAKTQRLERNRPLEPQLMAALDAFLDDRALDYEAMRLQERDEEFRTLMEEFRDGLLLFRVMEDSVWNAASRDSVGLRAYFDAHAEAYRFPDRTRLIGFYSRDDSLLADVAARLDAGATVADIQALVASDSTLTLRIDTTLVAGPTNSVYDEALSLQAGDHTDVLAYRNGHVLLVHDGIEPARPKTFEEARSEVVTAYQEVLEQRLLERLRQRYALYVFPERLEQAFAGHATATAPAGDSPTG